MSPSQQLIPVDLRKQERYRLLRQPAAALYIRAGRSFSEAMAIKDVSSGGVSVYLDHDLAVGSKVAVEYSAPHLTVNVNGMVIWCRARQESDEDAKYATDAYVLGIELFSPMILLSAFRDALPVHALSMGGA